MDFRKDVGQGLSLPPTRVVGVNLRQVADIADMVPFAVLLDIIPNHLLSGDIFNQAEGFQNGATVIPATSQIVNFARTGCGDERLD